MVLKRNACCKTLLSAYVPMAEASVESDEGVTIGDVMSAVGKMELEWELLDERAPFVDLHLSFGCFRASGKREAS